MLGFNSLSQEKYDTLSQKDNDTLYMIKNSSKMYRGEFEIGSGGGGGSADVLLTQEAYDMLAEKDPDTKYEIYYEEV